MHFPAQLITSRITSSIRPNVSGTLLINSTGSILKKLRSNPTHREATTNFQINDDVVLSIKFPSLNNLCKKIVRYFYVQCQ